MPTGRSRHVRFQEIADEIRRRILAGEVKPGERVGTYESLSKDYGAAIGTIRNAIAVLADEALITTIHGVGIFAAEPLPPLDAGHSAEYVDVMRQLAAISDQVRQLGERIAELEGLVRHAPSGRP
jgi:DNA-binding GntR family transcriptional regulator